MQWWLRPVESVYRQASGSSTVERPMAHMWTMFVFPKASYGRLPNTVSGSFSRELFEMFRWAYYSNSVARAKLLARMHTAATTFFEFRPKYSELLLSQPSTTLKCLGVRMDDYVHACVRFFHMPVRVSTAIDFFVVHIFVCIEPVHAQPPFSHVCRGMRNTRNMKLDRCTDILLEWTYLST